MAFSKNIKLQKLLWHIIIWFLYVIYVYVGNRFANNKVQLIQIIFLLTPYALIFYTNLYGLNLYKRKGILVVIVFLLTSYLIIIALCYFYVYMLLPHTGVNIGNYRENEVFTSELVSAFLTYFVFALLYFKVDDSLKKQKQIKFLEAEKFKLEQEKLQKELENAILKQQELERQKEKIQLEYAFLKTQINPHFLYNTLNVLFSQAMEYSQELADNILKLSSMMRYCLESVEFESGKVTVEKELQYLQTLIDINILRFGDSKFIAYEIIGNIDNHSVPPLSLITVVENAFKYGDLKDDKNPLQIKVTMLPQTFSFFCKNKKRKDNLELSSHNIGINNLKQRLDIAFNGNYEVKTIDDKNFYTFELIIKNTI
ncbi:MAG: histidine kinase [Limnohabitans sp.]|nr:histidine kinase [Limnohabitans sp.]